MLREALMALSNLGYRKQHSRSSCWSISGGSGHGSAFYTLVEDSCFNLPRILMCNHLNFKKIPVIYNTYSDESLTEIKWQWLEPDPSQTNFGWHDCWAWNYPAQPRSDLYNRGRVPCPPRERHAATHLFSDPLQNTEWHYPPCDNVAAPD